MTKLHYPTLDLFLYDLREGLGQTPAEIDQNRRRFQQKLPEINAEDFNQRDEQFFEPEFVQLFGEQRWHDFESETHDGYYYPVRIADTYGLLLDCSLKNLQLDADLQWLKDLQAYVNVKVDKQAGTLGQTWMFSAKLPNVPLNKHEALAKQCYEALMPGANYAANKIGHNDFFGGSLFELWQYTSPKSANKQLSDCMSVDEKENHHVIIIFYPNKAAAKKAASSLYLDWLRLLMYRHKMMWAYRQSRCLKQLLKQDFIEIQACIKKVSESSTPHLNFKALQETLRKMWEVFPRYTTKVGWLEAQCRTLEINLGNYQKRLATVAEKSGQTTLILENFAEIVRSKYSLQMQKDHAYFQQGSKLLDDSVRYIQAMVAIEEEKRERAFQGTIATWGIGLAAGAIVASVSGHFPTVVENVALQNPIGSWLLERLFIPQAWLAPSISLVLSIGAAVVAGLVTKIVIWLRRR